MTCAFEVAIEEAHDCLNRACVQIIMLDRRIQGLQKRFNMADRDGHCGFQYTIRMRLAVYENVRNMYYEYASKMKKMILCLENDEDSDDIEQPDGLTTFDDSDAQSNSDNDDQRSMDLNETTDESHSAVGSDEER